MPPVNTGFEFQEIVITAANWSDETPIDITVPYMAQFVKVKQDAPSAGDLTFTFRCPTYDSPVPDSIHRYVMCSPSNNTPHTHQLSLTIQQQCLEVDGTDYCLLQLINEEAKMCQTCYAVFNSQQFGANNEIVCPNCLDANDIHDWDPETFGGPS